MAKKKKILLIIQNDSCYNFDAFTVHTIYNRTDIIIRKKNRVKNLKMTCDKFTNHRYSIVKAFSRSNNSPHNTKNIDNKLKAFNGTV